MLHTHTAKAKDSQCWVTMEFVIKLCTTYKQYFKSQAQVFNAVVVHLFNEMKKKPDKLWEVKNATLCLC